MGDGALATVANDDTGRTGRVLLVSVAAAMGGFLFGYDTAVVNGAVEAIRAWAGLGDVMLGFSIASVLLGCAAGAWMAGPLADRYGRLAVMRAAAFAFFISSIGAGLAWDIWSFTFFRLLGGLAVGAASVITPAYIAEVAPAHLRGRMGSLQQMAIVVGIFIALLCNYLLADAAGGAAQPLWLGLDAWRWMFLVEVIPSILYGLMAGLIPESPRYLVSINDLNGAAAIIRRFLGTPPSVDARIQTIRETLGRAERQALSDLRGPAAGLLPVVWVGIFLSVFQQFVGINVIFYYSTVLWHAVGFTEADSLKITVMTSLTNIATTLVAIALVDRIGRKPLLLLGSTGMALALGLMAWIFSAAPTRQIADGSIVPVLNGDAGMIAVIAANLYVVFFGMSWGPVVWVLLGEMFNNRIRAYALAIAAAAQWLANFVVSQSFPILAGSGLGLAYGLYAGMAVLSFFFVWRFVMETKGRELEEME
ncbi:sugar porter family MFS transporter [Taklimakanibacter deserti]|uniref:sugar porter family MFS transporter n=1 Tax=Taklimakanibacter deserti TaxID=2267839 RepID=UPI000E64F02C